MHHLFMVFIIYLEHTVDITGDGTFQDAHRTPTWHSNQHSNARAPRLLCRRFITLLYTYNSPTVKAKTEVWGKRQKHFVSDRQNNRPLAPSFASAKHTSDPICSFIRNRHSISFIKALVPVNHPHVGPLLVLQRLCNEAAKFSILIQWTCLRAHCL